MEIMDEKSVDEFFRSLCTLLPSKADAQLETVAPGHGKATEAQLPVATTTTDVSIADIDHMMQEIVSCLVDIKEHPAMAAAEHSMLPTLDNDLQSADASPAASASQTQDTGYNCNEQCIYALEQPDAQASEWKIIATRSISNDCLFTMSMPATRDRVVVSRSSGGVTVESEPIVLMGRMRQVIDIYTAPPDADGQVSTALVLLHDAAVLCVTFSGKLSKHSFHSDMPALRCIVSSPTETFIVTCKTICDVAPDGTLRHCMVNDLSHYMVFTGCVTTYPETTDTAIVLLDLDCNVRLIHIRNNNAIVAGVVNVNLKRRYDYLDPSLTFIETRVFPGYPVITGIVYIPNTINSVVFRFSAKSSQPSALSTWDLSMYSDECASILQLPMVADCNIVQRPAFVSVSGTKTIFMNTQDDYIFALYWVPSTRKGKSVFYFACGSRVGHTYSGLNSLKIVDDTAFEDLWSMRCMSIFDFNVSGSIFFVYATDQTVYMYRINTISKSSCLIELMYRENIFVFNNYSTSRCRTVRIGVDGMLHYVPRKDPRAVVAVNLRQIADNNVVISSKANDEFVQQKIKPSLKRKRPDDDGMPKNIKLSKNRIATNSAKKLL